MDHVRRSRIHAALHRANRFLYWPWFLLMLGIGFATVMEWTVPDVLLLAAMAWLFVLIGLFLASFSLRPPRFLGSPFRGDFL